MIDTLMCPSDPNAGKVTGIGFHSNYLLVHGGQSVRNNAAYSDRDTMLGIFFALSSTRIRDVKDGTSNTAMVGEILLVENPNDRRGGLYASGFGTVNVTLALRDTPNGAPDQGSSARIINTSHAPSFHGLGFYRVNSRSRHTGGVLMGMADGSVQFVPDAIDVTVYQNMGNRADGA